jgi:epoxyqueuosine reductase
VKVFVDTAPLPEKPLAQQAGVGWQGKHTNLVSRELGSWLFLGTILTELDLPADPPEEDRCGSCRRCLDACPTDAFVGPYRLDARRCVSYLTIEHRGQIPVEFRAAMGNRIYGCDDCLAACPWNRFARAASEAKLKAREDLTAPPLAELALLDDAGFRLRFSGSPVKRVGPRPVRAQRAGRDRQQRRGRTRAGCRRAAGRSLAARARHGRVGPRATAAAGAGRGTAGARTGAGARPGGPG